MPELVSINIVDHVADVRLNRPDKYNALTPELMDALAVTAETLSQNKDVHAVVLSGEGKVFCSGLDLACLGLSDEFLAPFHNGSDSYPNRYQRPALCWRQLPVPVICALEGVAYGGGLQVALGADIRIAHPDCKLSLMEVKWGLIPDMGGSQTLQHIVRQDVAKELAFTGRTLLAPEAQVLGLVTSLSDTPRATALAMAAGIARVNPDAVSAGKYLLEQAWGADEQQGLVMEEALQSFIIGSANQREAVEARLKQRRPQFSERQFSDFNALKQALEKRADTNK